MPQLPVTRRGENLPMYRFEKTIDLDALEAIISRLKPLLAHREPGLMTWQTMLGDAVRDLEELFR